MRKTQENRATPVVPREFISRIRQAIQEEQTTAKEVAGQCGLSAAYFCRLLLGERGLPADTTILKMAEALNINPPDILLIDAGRLPEDIRPELNKPYRRDLLRATGNLTEAELQQVINTVKALRSQRSRRKSKP